MPRSSPDECRPIAIATPPAGGSTTRGSLGVIAAPSRAPIRWTPDSRLIAPRSRHGLSGRKRSLVAALVCVFLGHGGAAHADVRVDYTATCATDCRTLALQVYDAAAHLTPMQGECVR